MSGTVDSLIAEASRARREGHFPIAIATLNQAIALVRETGSKLLLAQALALIANVERDLGRPDPALTHYLEAVSLTRELGDPQRLAFTLRHLGDTLRELDSFEAAEAAYREALELYRADPSPKALDIANTVRGLALLATSTGRENDAQRHWTEARILYESVNVQEGVNEASEALLNISSHNPKP